MNLERLVNFAQTPTRAFQSHLVRLRSLAALYAPLKPIWRCARIWPTLVGLNDWSARLGDYTHVKTDVDRRDARGRDPCRRFVRQIRPSPSC